MDLFNQRWLAASWEHLKTSNSYLQFFKKIVPIRFLYLYANTLCKIVTFLNNSYLSSEKDAIFFLHEFKL